MLEDQKQKIIEISKILGNTEKICYLLIQHSRVSLFKSKPYFSFFKTYEVDDEIIKSLTRKSLPTQLSYFTCDNFGLYEIKNNTVNKIN